MMKTPIALFALAGLASIAFAQIPGLPSCAQSCVAIPQECQTTDFKCICSDSGFITNISCCIAKQCSASDQATVIKFAGALCGGYGVALPTVAGCSGTSSVPVSTPAPSASSAVVSSAAAVVSSVTASGSSGTAAGGSSSSAASVTTTTTTAQETTTVSASATHAGALSLGADMGSVGGVAGLVVGAMALL